MYRFLLGMIAGSLLTRLVPRAPKANDVGQSPIRAGIGPPVEPPDGVNSGRRAAFLREYAIWFMIEFFGALVPFFFLYLLVSTFRGSNPLSLTEFGGKGEFLLVASGLLFAQVAKVVGIRRHRYGATIQLVLALTIVAALIAAIAGIQPAAVETVGGHFSEERAVVMGLLLLLVTSAIAGAVSALKAIEEQ
jgi:hypothetical protein